MSASAIEETSPISPLFSSRFQSGRPRRPLCSFWQDIFLRSLVNGPSGERGTSLQATVGPKSRDLWQILLGKGALFSSSLSLRSRAVALKKYRELQSLQSFSPPQLSVGGSVRETRGPLFSASFRFVRLSRSGCATVSLSPPASQPRSTASVAEQSHCLRRPVARDFESKESKELPSRVRSTILQSAKVYLPPLLHLAQSFRLFG